MNTHNLFADFHPSYSRKLYDTKYTQILHIANVRFFSDVTIIPMIIMGVDFPTSGRSGIQLGLGEKGDLGP